MPVAGLTEAEAARLLAERGDPRAPASSRSVASIVRANVFTPFNAILVALGALTLAFVDWRDALFLAIVIANTTIGIWQEVRAKRKLDSLAALVAPVAVVVRDGAERRVHVEDVVVGDLVRIAPGDQVVADGDLVEVAGLLVDEAILTGESEAVRREVGDEIRSGSFAVEGTGAYVVHAVGEESYAERITGAAREFRHPRSPLERAVTKLVYILAAIGLPLAVALVVALAKQDVDVERAIETAVAGTVTLVPEGLILLLSITYAAGAVRLARRGALTQQLNAIESLASVDTLCIDKTGTLTQPRLRVLGLLPAPGVEGERLRDALGSYAASSPDRNLTLDAVAEAVPGAALPVEEAVPFASRRRWGALRLGGSAYVLGEPDLFPLGPLAADADRERAEGRRVVAFGAVPALPEDPDAGPGPLRTLGVVVLAEELRADIRETVAFLDAEGVRLMVLSGDDPATVAAIAADAGMRVDGGAVDARALGEGIPVEDALDAPVIGRITPEGKRRIVEALAARGSYVAMVGDGVNDVPALKAARLGVAQGSGTQMAKAVADVVLVRGDFAAFPGMVAEGRKILRNIQRVAKLFVAKSVFAAVLIVSIGITPTEYPLLPRHMSLVATLAVGVPAFFLALAPSEGPWRTDQFLREIGRFSVPAGVATGLGVLVSYLVTLNVLGAGLEQARTTATTTLLLAGLYLVLALDATGGRRSRWVGTLCVALLSVYAVVLALPPLRDFFELEVPEPWPTLMALVGAAVAAGFLWVTDDRFVPGRQRPAAGEAGSPAVR